jgi:hypothetical protein
MKASGGVLTGNCGGFPQMTQQELPCHYEFHSAALIPADGSKVFIELRLLHLSI